MNQHKFSRMDAGQKRNPLTAKRTKLSNGKEAVDRPRNDTGQFLPAIPEDQQPAVIANALKAYNAGIPVEDIAKEYGVSSDSIYSWMLGELGPTEYHNLITRTLVSRVHKADRLLETAPDPLNLSRGREMAKFARMDLERRRPSLYGVKQEITTNVSPVLNISIVAQPQTVEIDVTPVTAKD